jgi:alkylation response protein AidB-like acyl-CoA dehydrogenase
MVRPPRGAIRARGGSGPRASPRAVADVASGHATVFAGVAMPFHGGPASLSRLAEQVAAVTTHTCLPLAEPYADSNELPHEPVTAPAREGAFPLNLPASCGGQGLPCTSTISLHREHFGYASPACDATYDVQTLGTGAIVHVGTPEQQNTCLSRPSPAPWSSPSG